MKDEVMVCKRCKVEISIKPMYDVGLNMYMRQQRRLGWESVGTYALGDFILCPHCVHELRQFLDGKQSQESKFLCIIGRWCTLHIMTCEQLLEVQKLLEEVRKEAKKE